MNMRSFACLVGILAFFFLAVSVAQAQVVVYSGPAPGTFGNDTAATLYLRPLNNAILGTAYFGAGYPRATPSLFPIPQPPAPSGILRANDYLTASGWTAWQREKQALVAENAELKQKLQDLEARLATIEATLRQSKPAASR